jgi:hypothetical protein
MMSSAVDAHASAANTFFQSRETPESRTGLDVLARESTAPVPSAARRTIENTPPDCEL